jgi:nitrogen fixation/metabolism regulation signal transduction histidine kinase
MEDDKNRDRLTAPTESRLQQSQDATERIVRKLEINQIELVRQNDELREAKHEVTTALEKYTDLYETAPVGYFTLDTNWLISSVNLAGSNLLRIERSLLTGRSFEQLIVEEFRPTFTTFLTSVFGGQSDEACEVVILDNVCHPITVQIEAAISASGKECRLALIDISGRDGDTPHVQATGPTVEKLQEDEDNAENSSKAEPGKMGLELCVFSLREALDATFVLLKEKAHREGIEFNMDLAPEVDVRIVADQTKLKQILFSLVSNAVKFTPEGGKINVSAVRDDDFIEITVADTGKGIKSEDTPNLFRAFTKIELSDTKEDEDSGLGLAQTKQLVDQLGGRIRVESQCGEGSRFSFTIPFRDCMGIT